MKKLSILILVLLFPVTAQANENSAVCKLVASHQPDSGVIHRPGADVATDSQTAFQVPDIVRIPLNVDLAQRVQRLSDFGLDLDAPLGMLEIHQDGSVKYNGQDWTTPILTLCGQSHGIKQVVEEPKVAEPIINKKPIINRTKILNKTPIINRVPAGDRAGEVSTPKDGLPAVDAIESVPVKAEEAPKDLVPQRADPVITTTQSDRIEGGSYKDFHYNE